MAEGQANLGLGHALKRLPSYHAALLLFCGGAAVASGPRYIFFALWSALASGLVAFRLIRGSDRKCVPALIFSGMVLGLIALQLVPLPDVALRWIPGRAHADAVRDLIGVNGWHPLALDRPALLAALSAVFPFLATLLWVATGPRRDMRFLQNAVAIAALVSLILGMVQKATGGVVADFYGTQHIAFSPGLFANRNHAAIFMALAVVLFLPRLTGTRLKPQSQAVLAAGIIIAVIGAILATASRAGLLIGGAMMATAWVCLIKANGAGKWANWKWMSAGALLAAAVVVPLALKVQVIAESSARFESIDDDLRWRIYVNSWAILVEHLPLGGGLGSFVPLYSAREPLEEVWTNYINHAHNDWLELTIETGLLWMPIAAYLLASLVRAAKAKAQLPRHDRLSSDCAAIVIAGLAVHSLFDYPVRAPAIAVALALSISMVLRQSRKQPSAAH